MRQNPSDWTRRDFLRNSTAVVAASAIGTATVGASTLDESTQNQPPQVELKPARLPIVIASANGLPALDKAMTMLRAKADPLDAVIAAVNIVEDDPEDHSVGLGGLPNEDGVVELDASVMHGPTHKAGGVAALRSIRHASSVARLIMQRTDHVLLVGEGALRFAKAHGFKEEDLLTEESRKIWLNWRESHSRKDDWLSPDEATGPTSARGRPIVEHTWGTINCCAVDAAGNIAGVTSTSGLSYKIPGRVGDSPIIGAGLYVDNAVGAAGSTGRGESNLQNCSSFYIVELMRSGKNPQQACLEALKRVAERTEPRLRDKSGRPAFGLTFYAVAKDGRYGAASMLSGAEFAVHDGSQARREKCAYLYEAPPTPPASRK